MNNDTNNTTNTNTDTNPDTATKNKSKTTAGAKSVGEIIKAFNFLKIDPTATTQDNDDHDHVHLHLPISLTPHPPILTPSSLRSLPKPLKVALLSSVKLLDQIPEEERSWDALLATLTQNPLLRPGNEKNAAGVHRRDCLALKSSHNITINAFRAWFRRLVLDDDVLEVTGVDKHDLRRMQALTNEAIASFYAEPSKDKEREKTKTVVDVGGVRVLKDDRACFQVYRIRLVAFATSVISNGVAGASEETNGVRGEYDSQSFIPCETAISSMNPQALERAASDAEDLFG